MSMFLEKECLLPVEIKGIGDTVDPEVIGDLASGVDTTSRTADPSSAGYTEDIWIMAPIGGVGNRVEMSLGANENLEMTLSAETGFSNPQLLTESPGMLTWFGEGAGGDESPVEISIGGSEKEELPIKVKNMKRETLRVIIHPITLQKADGTTDEPDFIPTEDEMKEYLDRVFKEQINLECQVTVNSTRTVAWDVSSGSTVANDPNSDYAHPFLFEVYSPVPGDGILDLNDNATYPEPTLITGASDTGGPGPGENIGNIHVYLIGGAATIRTLQLGGNPGDPNVPGVFFRPKELAVGLANVSHSNPRRCWLADAALQNAEAAKHTIAHEIGHFIVGPGHPDEPEENQQGVAPLNGTDHSLRLMVSGREESRQGRLGIQLVKAEWDEAEIRVDAILQN